MTMLQRLADVHDARSLSNRLRARRFARFERLVAPLPRPLRIIDLGGTPSFWQQRGWADRGDVEITTVNLEPMDAGGRALRTVVGDVTDLDTLPDGAYDVAFSNSVIEHLHTFENQQRMAATIRRLAPACWVQTPNYWFPIEPHFHVPGWQWMPHAMRRRLIQRTRCGWRGPCPDPREADDVVREVRLLRRRELRRLFPDATIEPERFGGLTKSWIIHHGFEQRGSPIPCSPS